MLATPKGFHEEPHLVVPVILVSQARCHLRAVQQTPAVVDFVEPVNAVEQQRRDTRVGCWEDQCHAYPMEPFRGNEPHHESLSHPFQIHRHLRG